MEVVKVAVNTCYGGFRLSQEALDLYAKKAGLNTPVEGDKRLKLRCKLRDQRDDPILIEVIEELGTEKASDKRVSHIVVMNAVKDDWAVQDFDDGIEEVTLGFKDQLTLAKVKKVLDDDSTPCVTIVNELNSMFQRQEERYKKFNTLENKKYGPGVFRDDL